MYRMFKKFTYSIGVCFLLVVSGCMPNTDVSSHAKIVKSQSSPGFENCFAGKILIEVPQVNDKGEKERSSLEKITAVSCPNSTTTVKYQVGKTTQEVTTYVEDKDQKSIDEKRRKDILLKLTDEEAAFVGIKK